LAERVQNMGPPSPDGKTLTVEQRELRFVWPNHRVAADIGPFPDEVTDAADAIGFAVIGLPKEPMETPPADLAELLGSTP